MEALLMICSFAAGMLLCIAAGCDFMAAAYTKERSGVIGCLLSGGLSVTGGMLLLVHSVSWVMS